MMREQRVAAFGDAKRFIHHLAPGDIVFFSHRNAGLVAAARVKKGAVRSAAADDELYREVEFLTPTPDPHQPLRAMPFARVSQVTGKSFYWARTIKVPYLSREEADTLVAALRECLVGSP
jgi:hypothetical protein